MRIQWIGVIATICLAGALVACQEEGPAESAGRQIDQAAEDAAGSLEKLGREIGEAADESKEAAEELRDSIAE